MPEPSDHSDVRRAILRQWMHDNDRAPAWVARRIGLHQGVCGECSRWTVSVYGQARAVLCRTIGN